MAKGIFSVAAVLAALAMTAAAADAPEEAPDVFGDNPALPRAVDLIEFAGGTDVVSAQPDVLGAIQNAFPAYYGSMPATVSPVDPADVAAGGDAGTAVFAAAAQAPEEELPPEPEPAEAERTAAATAAVPVPEELSAPDELAAAEPQPAAAAPENDPLPATPADGGTIDLAMATPVTGSADRAPPPERPAPAPAAAPPVDIAAVRNDFNRIKTFCDEESFGSAAEIYTRMPDFGGDAEANRLRADAANLLILGLSRADNLSAARRIYESVPAVMAGEDAMLAKARAVINLATYYVRAERYSDAFAVLLDIGQIPNRSALANELFRLMARMIPYLDNADETDKAETVFDLLLAEVNSDSSAALFAENIPGVFKYYLHYVDKSEAPRARRRRLDFLEHAFAAMAEQSGNAGIRETRKSLGESLAARYAGDPERAARFYVEE